MTTRLTRDQLEKEYAKRKLEKDVQHEVCAYLLESHRPLSITDATEAFNRHGQRVNRVKRGWPDVTTVTKDGRLFGIECKRPIGGRLDPDQAKTLKKLHEWGALICIARSVADVQEAEECGTRAADLAEIEKEMTRPRTKAPVNEWGF